MNLLSIRHLHWVLWIWLLLPESNGEDGVGKSEKRIVIKQESGPRGDSLVRSYTHTRVSRAFSSSSTFDQERGESIDNKPPDDKQSTIRIKNETVDLSKNTVPVLKYPGPTEPSLKDKYKRTTPSPLTTPVKKGFKLKRNMTRPRPSDLTTLLAFNALTPSPQAGESSRTRPLRYGYLSTTQVAESMPPTAWALASLKGPLETTRKPGPPNVKPFVSWSTRLNKPTTPSPTTEATEPATMMGETTVESEVTSSDITAEGADFTVTTVQPTPEASSSSSELPTSIKKQNDTVKLNNSSISSTEKTQDITSYKPEENTISVPSLSSLKNKTLDFIDKKDLASDVQLVSHEESSLVPEKSGMQTVSSLYSPQIHSSISFKNDTENLNYTSQESSSLPSVSEILNISTSHDISNPLLSTESDEQSTPISYLNNSSSIILSNQTSELISNNNSQQISEPTSNTSETTTIIGTTVQEVSKTNEGEATEEKVLPFVNSTTHVSSNNGSLNVDFLSESHESPEHPHNSTIMSDSLLTSDSIPVKPIREVDPSINTINEKKNNEPIPTSTVISTVNSSISMHVVPVLTTPGNLNFTNLIKDELKKAENQIEFTKNLPLTAETTTTSSSISSSTEQIHSPTPFPSVSNALTISVKEISSQPEHENTTINQTINDIKPVSDINLEPLPPSANADTTSSPRSNDIKPENSKNTSNSSNFEIKQTNQFMQDTPETTQSNYIQVNESIKPQNKTVVPHYVMEDQTSKPSIVGFTIPITTVKPLTTTNAPVQNQTMPATVIPVIPTEIASVENVFVTENPTTVGTTPPVTTTPLPTTTMAPPAIITTFPPVTSDNITSTINMTSITLSTSVSTTKSNEIKDPDGLPDSNFPLDRNMTNFQYETPNASKNESTTLIIQEPEDTDDEDVSYNHTDFSDKKHPSDTINNGDSEDDNEDILPDGVITSTVSDSKHNNSKDILVPAVTTTLPTSTTTKISTTTPNIDDMMSTQINEDQTNFDEGNIYENGISSVYTRITFLATYNELCKERDHLRDAIVRIFKKYSRRIVDKRQVVLANLGLRECSDLRGEMDQRPTSINLMLTDIQGQYDKSLNDIFFSLASNKQLDFKYPIAQVEEVIGQHELNLDNDSQPSGTVVAAIVISSIAGVCLLALTILLVIMRKRQSGFNYGQRCTPVSLDDYSLDNISVYNSVRRKAMRASKRSYGNPAFDDPDVISNPVNFAGLANMSSDKSKTDEEFSNLPQVSIKPDELPPGAELKNRYANVIPLPETRVQLRGNSPQDQFINANYVKGAKGVDKCYIACQAPLPNTIEDFWQMVWDEQCRLIIMLTALSEDGVEKCADYLPPSEVLDCHRVFGDLQVTLKKREAREKYVIASLQLKNLETNLWREVTHMWYAGWPVTGVPQEPSSVIAFLIEARSYSKSAPVVVHCSPGTGRTGTIIAIDIAIRDFEAGRSVDIPKTVIQVRRGRAGAVQTKDQYHFIYKVLHLYATKLTGGGLDSI